MGEMEYYVADETLDQKKSVEIRGREGDSAVAAKEMKTNYLRYNRHLMYVQSVR